MKYFYPLILFSSLALFSCKKDGEGAGKEDEKIIRKGDPIEVVDGTATLGIRVCTNADLRASVESWQPVSFRKSDLDVSADGTRILAPVPANADRGFMVLRSGN